MAKQPYRYDQYDDDELADMLRNISSGDIRYPGAKFEWDRRQDQKKARRWWIGTVVAILTLFVLLASFVVQYRSWKASSGPNTSASASVSASPTVTPVLTTPSQHHP
jgi:hypothetical protein